MTDAVLCQEIPLAAVDLEDQTFVVPSDEPDLSRLLASMEEAGLINPPWLRARADDRWQAVTGAKRLKAAAALGWAAIPARTLPAAAPEPHCLLLALYDNAFTRGFNLREQAWLAQRLLDHWDRATVAGRFLPYLGLPPSAAHLDRLLKVNHLPPEFLGLCAQGRLALTAAAALAHWQAADRAAAWPYLAGLTFSQSKQEQFLEDVELLARRDGVTGAEVLSRRPLREALAAPGLNLPERTAAVRRVLKGWVNPRLNAAQGAFQESLRRLGLKAHPRLSLSPPPAFEGPDFLLEIKFRDAPELRQLLDELGRLLGQEEFPA